jgi:hypothetical protein
MKAGDLGALGAGLRMNGKDQGAVGKTAVPHRGLLRSLIRAGDGG